MSSPDDFKSPVCLAFRQDCGTIRHNLQQCNMQTDNTHKTKGLIKQQRTFAHSPAKCQGETCTTYKGGVTLSMFAQECTRAHARILYFALFLSKEFKRLFKGLLEDPHPHCRHFVHEGAEFKMPNSNLARACCLRDAIRLSWVFGG